MKRSLLLSVLLMGVVVSPAAARLEMHSSARTVEITGGEGARVWKLVYGATPDDTRQLLEVSPGRAYFAHGGWIRLIDTVNGVVIERWHIGPNVVALKRTAGESVDADTYERTVFWGPTSSTRPVFTNTISVGPGSKPPLMPAAGFFFQSVSRAEARRDVPEFSFTEAPKLKAERARQLLPAAEDMARRDPLSPWMAVIYGYLLLRAGDPRAEAVITHMVESPGGDFTEWLPISAYLYDIGRADLAQMLYDRGYKDLLEHGYDPRILRAGYYRMGLFAPRMGAVKTLLDQPPDVVERTFRLAPYPEYGWLMWRQFANEYARQGRTTEAQLWRARATEAETLGRAPAEVFSLGFDRWLLVAMGTFLALILYVIVVNRRYTAQHRVDMEAGLRKWTVPGLSNLTYWTRAPRLALLLIVLAGWAATGILGMYGAALVRAQFGPSNPWSGTYGGRAMRWYLQRLPASPQRDLLLAMSYQQDGDRRRAEETYRALPQFAESWNNLGVVLKRQGDEEQARAAFRRALQLNPQLHEAQFNLDGSTPDLWTQLHKQYVPNRPMIAIARPEQLAAAYQGGRSTKNYLWRALRGPFWPTDGYALMVYVAPLGRSERAVRILAETVWTTALMFALFMLFFMRRSRVDQTPCPRHWIGELVFPGTAPAWNILGGLVLALWTACWVGVAFWPAFGSPWMMTSVQLWFMRWYTRTTADSRGLLNPSWWWFAGVLLMVFGVNAAVVLRGRRATGRTVSAAGSTS